MFYIKLDDNMILTAPRTFPIFQKECLAREITVLIPAEIGDLDTSSMTLYFCYLRSDGYTNVVTMTPEEELYKERFYQCRVPLYYSMTRIPGKLYVWIQIYGGGANNPIVAKSSDLKLYVIPAHSISELIDDEGGDIREGILTAIYQLQQNLTVGLENRANGLVYNSDANTIQLTSDGATIGEAVDIREFGVGVQDIEIDDSGDLLVTYDGGETVNLGIVSGDGWSLISDDLEAQEEP